LSRIRSSQQRFRVLSVVFATLFALVGGAAITMVTSATPAAADSTHQVAIGMPFSGKWAYNTDRYAPYDDSTSSHPSVHHTPGGGDWATDLYGGEGTAVKLKVGAATGNVTFSWASSSTSCGQSTRINVFVDGVSVGWLYFAHVNNAVTSGIITNGMTIGTVHNWGDCNPGVHVHVEFHNTANYACYVAYDHAGVSVGEGANIGVLGSINTGGKQACTSVPTGTSTGSNADILAVVRNDAGSGHTATHVVNGANWGQYLLNSATGLPVTDSNWDFDWADYNGDGTADLWAFNRAPGYGHTVLHVLNGANLSQWLQAGDIALPATDSNWSFRVADYNGDGTPDIFGINRAPGYGHTVVHVINGANWGQYLQVGDIALPATDGNWDFDVANFNGSGKPDIVGFNRAPGYGHTVVHVINGDNWGEWLQAGDIALPATDSNWSFAVGNRS
jgi:hypothetical protein